MMAFNKLGTQDRLGKDLVGGTKDEPDQNDGIGPSLVPRVHPFIHTFSPPCERTGRPQGAARVRRIATRDTPRN